MENHLPDTVVKDNATGMGGWLAFFVITSALGIIYSLITELRDFSDLKNQIPEAFPQAYLGLLLEFLFYGIYGYVLYELCALKEKAVPHIKAVLIFKPVVFLAALAVIGLVFQAAFPGDFSFSGFYAVALKESGKDLLQPIVHSIIWYLYFVRSERVKKTYARRDLLTVFN